MSAVPTLAAVTLDEHGGGIAAASRLIWRVMGEAWGWRRQLVTLDPLPKSGRPSFRQRVQFGVRLASLQAAQPNGWVLFTHLGLARAETFLPPAVRRPYAIFLHGIEAWRPLNERERQVLRGASLRLANSRYTARRVALANPDIGPIECCPLALDCEPTAFRPPLDIELRRAMGSSAVLLVGRMSAAERYKGHDALLEAWPRVLSSQPDARLVLVGDGDDRGRLVAKSQALGIASHVVFPGFLSADALASLYGEAAVFAMPSRGEGFGLVYLEAMAHGLPCIGSTHDAAGEVIEDGVTGFLVDQDDQDRLARLLTDVLGNEAARRRMGDAGRARVRECFSYRQFADRFLELIRPAFAEESLALTAASSPTD